ncbi:Chitin synthase, class 3 [Umbelopsis sp. WA50703]
MDPNTAQSYEPQISRSRSSASRVEDGLTTGVRPRRQKSLVRPERERIDPNHRQFHYRQRATEHLGVDRVAASTTGNIPLHYQDVTERRAQRLPSFRRSIRRGKSILGREEPPKEKTHVRPATKPLPKAVGDRGGADTSEEGIDSAAPANAVVLDNELPKGKLPDVWSLYVRTLTCCFPSGVLRSLGLKDERAQYAWREKIGLLSIIACIMAFVGFLTFGFTEAVCPTPPLSFHAGSINNGYLLINGWAYQLSSWQNHPAIPGVTNESTNPLYPPINAGGMDATFLFQNVNQRCLNVITPKPGVSIHQNGNSVPTYFPCRMFNPNNTIAPDANTYSNYSGCHLTQNARQMYYQFSTQGVPNNKNGFDKAGRVYYNWEDVTPEKGLMVYNSDVLNLNLLQSLPQQYFNVPSGGLIQTLLSNTTGFTGQDMTRHISAYRGPTADWKAEADCLADIITVGALDTESIGCIASDIVLYVSLVVILGVIICKFVLAVIFGWFLSWKLGNFNEGNSYKERMKREAEIENWTEGIYQPADAIKPKNPYAGATSASPYGGLNARRKTFLPQTSRFTQPEFGSNRFNALDRPPSTVFWNADRAGSSSPGLGPMAGSRNSMFGSNFGTPPASPSLRGINDSASFHRQSQVYSPSRRSSVSSSGVTNATQLSICPFPLSKHVVPQPKPDYMPFNFQLAHTICLVTCYSEGEEGIRTTLDSIATTDYPNSHKLILVVCDGVITGHGNNMSTPDICVSMMRDFIVPKEQVQPYSYVAIADGSKRHNMAKIYGGYYKYDNNTVDPSQQQRVPMVVVVKCGTPEEAKEKKPGNRGKRDSQIVLMSFMQKVMFDERMTLMEYEFFNTVWRITGVSPDRYEICLMVDADTKVYPDALSRLVSCMVKDPEIAGLCGETKIGNKTDSWVTMIQVFEYYISHHQSKAFESIFGGVTCLPGCFCMYRIKAPKGPNGYWVPILANPDIVEHYSENVVDTLHKKNLLLLGEDRYLSTLMLRTFPKRKMVFVPQAVCKTVVPDTFAVLLSQRRRWINSTIHNLMELVLVRDLCGTFCFSMQFVVFMELVGTVALPAAISFTLYLIILAIMGKPAIIPLILLAVILGLPAVLIVMTSRKVVYVGWMLVYLFSLPIWNFVLPAYAFWHFDDFSWGETRKVAGNAKETSHGDKEGEFDSSKIVMKRWGDYEKDRKIRLAAEAGLPAPKFVDRSSRLDIFRDSTVPANNYTKAGSTGSSDSDLPFNQSEYIPAGYNSRRHTRNGSVELLRLPSPGPNMSTPSKKPYSDDSYM